MLLQRRLDWILLLEDSSQLLQRALTRLHKQEVNHNDLHRIPEDEQEVILPSGLRKRNSSDERIVERRDVDEELPQLAPTLMHTHIYIYRKKGVKLTLFIPIPFARLSYRKHSTGYIA